MKSEAVKQKVAKTATSKSFLIIESPPLSREDDWLVSARLLILFLEQFSMGEE
jgi:hypothetical protein